MSVVIAKPIGGGKSAPKDEPKTTKKSGKKEK